MPLKLQSNRQFMHEPHEQQPENINSTKQPQKIKSLRHQLLSLVSHRPHIVKQRRNSCVEFTATSPVSDDDLTSNLLDIQKMSLKKCASTGTTKLRHSRQNAEWGMVSVLNELEYGKSFEKNPKQRLCRQRQLLQTTCRNCSRLFFKEWTPIANGEFCSLDCKTSCEYVIELHNLVDAHLYGDEETNDEKTDQEDVEEVNKDGYT